MTIAVVPRETVSQVRATLENLTSSTRVPYRLVVVDGGYPKRTGRWLDAFARAHDATLLRSDYPLTPNEARNAALRAVDTEYVVFLDDNCFVRDGWLEPLLRCAEETGAGIVAPLYGFRTARTGKETVHVFAGQAHVETIDGSRVLVDSHLHSGKPLDEAVAELTRTRAEAAEFHCMLVQRRVFDEIGPLDEQLITAREHLDACMRARDAGYDVWFEPSAVAVYELPLPIPARDRALFVYRWSRKLTERTLDHFAETWQLDPVRLRASTGAFVEKTRRLAYNLSPRLLNRAFHKMGRGVVGTVDRVADAGVVAYYTRRRSRSGGIRVAHAASWLDERTTAAPRVSRPGRRDATARSG